MRKNAVFLAAALIAALVVAATGCDLRDPLFIPVSFIEGVPETGTAGTPLVLTGTVRPGFASNSAIVWQIKNAGATGASINGKVLNAQAAGWVLVTAKIANGKAGGRAFTQDFIIIFTGGGAAPVVYTVTFETNGGGDIAPQSVAPGQTALRPATPVKPGFDFVNWYDNADLIDPPYNFDTPVTANITLYAYWIETGTAVPVTGVTLDKTTLSFSAIGATETLTATVAPADATNTAVTWTSNNTAVATVDKGTVTAVGAGSATITVTTTDGNKTATCTVTVVHALITSIDAFATWLAAQPPNTADKPYTVKLNVSDLGGDIDTPVSVGYTLQENSNKYVSLDLSGSTIDDIPEMAFYLCKNLIGITIPDSVENIGWAAFNSCTSLKSVTIPDNVTIISPGVFFDCTSLTSVTIPDSVTNIWYDAFGDCTGLTSVEFKGTDWIENDNFSNVAFPGNLKEVYMSSDGGPGTYTRPVNGSTWTKQ